MNQRVINRAKYLFYLPKYLMIMEKVFDHERGMRQIIKDNDGNRTYATFNGANPPPKPTEENMRVFLKDQGFSNENIELILIHYSQRPSYAATSIARRLLQENVSWLLDEYFPHISKDDLKYTTRHNELMDILYVSIPENIVIDIKEINGKVFYQTISSAYSITDANKKIIAEIGREYGEIASSFNLTQDGFKFHSFTTTGVFTNLLHQDLLKESNRIGDAIFLYCLACNEESKVEIAEREKLKKQCLATINEFLSDDGLRQLAIHHLFYENQSYYKNKEGYYKLLEELKVDLDSEVEKLLTEYTNEYNGYVSKNVSFVSTRCPAPEYFKDKIEKAELIDTHALSKEKYPKQLVSIINKIEAFIKLKYFKKLRDDRQKTNRPH